MHDWVASERARERVACGGWISYSRANFSPPRFSTQRVAPLLFQNQAGQSRFLGVLAAAAGSLRDENTTQGTGQQQLQHQLLQSKHAPCKNFAHSRKDQARQLSTRG